MADYPHTNQSNTQFTLTSLIQEEPPHHKRGRKSDIEPWLDVIRVDPGVWFKYPEVVTPSSQQVAVRYRATEDGPAYEATFWGDKRYDKVGTIRPGWLYARYIGKPDSIR